MVQSPCKRASQPKRQGQTGKGDRRGHPPVTGEEAHIGLEPDEEQIQDEPEVGHEGEIRDGLGGEDGSSEPGDSPHDRRPQKDAADDFSDDSRLADLLERPVKQVTHDDD